MGLSCLICTELFDGTKEVSAAPCGHTFHRDCLLNWLQQSPTCPQCRERVRQNKIIKLYFNRDEDGGESNGPDVAHLQASLDRLHSAHQQKISELATMKVSVEGLSEQLSSLREKHNALKEKHAQESAARSVLQRSLQESMQQQKEAARAQDEATALRRELTLYKNIKALLKDCEADVKQMVSSSDPQQTATWCAVLQKELTLKRQEGQRLHKEVSSRKKENIHLQLEIKRLQEQLAMQSQLNSSLCKTPKRSRAFAGLENDDASFSRTPNTTEKVKRLRIVSGERAQPTPVQSSSDKSAPDVGLPSAALAYIQKTTAMKNANKSSSVRVAYNGLGGHEKVVVQQNKKPKFDLFKRMKTESASSVTSHTPPLPRLNFENHFS